MRLFLKKTYNLATRTQYKNGYLVEHLQKTTKLCRSCVCFVGAKKWKQKKLEKTEKIVCFFEKNNTIIFINFREKMSQSWMNLILLFLPYRSSQVKPSQTIFRKKYTKFEFVWSTKKYVFCYVFYDYEEKNVKNIVVCVRDTMIFKGKSILKELWISVITKH